MINLWTQFPQRAEHRLAVLVDSVGFEIKFIPENRGSIGSWYPEPSGARAFIDAAECYLADRKFSLVNVGGSPPKEVHIAGCKFSLISSPAEEDVYFRFHPNGALTRIQMERGGEQFTAQVVDEELRNVVGALRVYFHFERKVVIQKRGKDW